MRQFVCVCMIKRRERNCYDHVYNRALILLFFLSEHYCFPSLLILYCLLTSLSLSSISGGRASASALLAQPRLSQPAEAQQPADVKKTLFHLNLLHSATPLFGLHFTLSPLLCASVCVCVRLLRVFSMSVFFPIGWS